MHAHAYAMICDLKCGASIAKIKKKKRMFFFVFFFLPDLNAAQQHVALG